MVADRVCVSARLCPPPSYCRGNRRSLTLLPALALPYARVLTLLQAIVLLCPLLLMTGCGRVHPPLSFVQYFELHKKIYDWFDIQFDYFGRTSCEEPSTDTTWPQTQITQEIFLDLERAGVTEEQSVNQGESRCPHCLRRRPLWGRAAGTR
jgi:hypothetical protein